MLLNLDKEVSVFLYLPLILVLSFLCGLLVYRQSFLISEVKETEFYGFPEKTSIESQFCLGQNIIVGIPGTEINSEIKDFIRKIKPAGIVLYARNFGSPSQFKGLIKNLQSILKEETGCYGFIMLDEEPGGASRLYLFQDAFFSGLPSWKNIERDIMTLQELGINVELAPLADFPFNKSAFVERRIPAQNPEDLIRFNETFIDLLLDHEIEATLKHFPGLGMVNEDTHKVLPFSEVEMEKIKESSLIFEKGIEAGANFVMTGHVIYEAIDPAHPATLSKKTVDFLREIGFEGIVITDDISEMSLIEEKEDLVQVGIQSIESGHNLIMFSHKLENTEDVFPKILAYMKENPAFEKRVRENCKKILDFKSSNLPN